MIKSLIIYLSKFSLLLLLIMLLFSNCDVDDIISSQGRYEVLFDSLYYTGNQWSDASDILEVSSGGYIVAGRLGSSDNLAVLVRINESGEQVWRKSYSGERLHSVIETVNGFVAVGGSAPGGYILGIDEQGNVLWEKDIAFPYAEDARKIIQTSAGDFFIPVNSYEVHGKARLVKLFSYGVTNWIKIIEGDSRTRIYSVAEDLDGNIKLIEEIEQDSLSSNWLVTLDRNGNELSKKIISEDVSAIASTWHELSTIRTHTGNLAGVGNEYFFLIDTSGNIISKKNVPIPYKYDQIRLYSIFPQNDNSFIAAGFQWKWVENDSTHVYESQTYGGLFFLNPEGDLHENIVIGSECINNAVTSVLVSRDKTIVITGYYIPCGSTATHIWVKRIRLL